MNTPSIFFSSSASVQASHPEVPLCTRVKIAMISEGSLIATNLKGFITWVGLSSAAIAQTASEDSPAREWTLTAALVIAIGYLVRSQAVKDKKIEELYKKIEQLCEKLAKKDDDDDGKGGRPRRHTQ